MTGSDPDGRGHAVPINYRTTFHDGKKRTGVKPISAERPLVLDIKGNSLDDGPGIRTVVFVKGCPLSCVWCHNPESKSPSVEISFDAEECVACDTCLATCPHEAVSKENRFFIDRDRCTLCFDCVETCPSGALNRVGRDMSVDEIVAQVIKDKPFFDTSGGGVTLSGGEPTFHMTFLSTLLQALKAYGIQTLLETCGYFDFKRFADTILPHLDIIYYDIKTMDSDEHQRYCGVPNGLILDNFSRLLELTRIGGFELLPRTPLIPEFTDTASNIRGISDFLKQHGVTQAQLLAYNPLWHEKTEKMGTLSPLSQNVVTTNWMARENIVNCEEIFNQRGISTVSR